MDVLLILGSVTVKQYESVRIAMLQSGMKPKVVRMDVPRHVYDEKLATELIRQAFVDNSTEDVKVVYKLEYDTGDAYGDLNWEWVEDHLPSTAVVVIGHKNADGSDGCWIDQAVVDCMRSSRN